MAQERLIEDYLDRGELQAARQAVMGSLEGNPTSQELRLQLALVQLLQAVEGYAQAMYRVGLKESFFGGMIPFLRLPVEPNPDPTLATNQGVRQALQQLSVGLAEAQKTLTEIPDSWNGRVPLRLGRIRIDFDGDGVARPKEELWRVLDAINPGLGIEEKSAAKFGIHLDAGDVRWLEGYCHLLNALLDVGLAYDTQRLFDHTGHRFFAKTESPFPFLVPAPSSSDEDFIQALMDGVAFIHLLDLPLLEAGRMESAMSHFREVIALSHRSWACILAETDDTYEWIPNPSQKSAVPGWVVTAEMVNLWMEFLAEADSILAGDTLLPFWRNLPPDQGLNLAKVFSQPQAFDAVLWLQGPGAMPYLEKGKVTKTDFWSLLNRAFDGQFLGFALWFN